MIKFWEQASSSLATRLFSVGGAALVFWLWAAAIWAIPRGGWSYLEGLLKPLFREDRATLLLVVLVAIVVVVWVSSLVVERLTLPVLRLLEGYWPKFADPLRRWSIGRWRKKLDALSVLPSYPPTPPALTTSQLRMWRFPGGADVMPTRIGNIIRGGERRPAYWYGLDAIVVWPQLWLVLPTQARGDLTQAREQLDRAVAAFIWAILACGLAFVLPWALAVSVITAWVIWRWWIPNAAEDYATLISAVFDTHRFALYDALHYPRPKSPALEKKLGEALTTSLWSSLHKAPGKYASD